MPELRIRPNPTNLSGNGEIQLLYEAVDSQGIDSTGDTITSLDIFFNETEILADTNSAPITLVQGASLFGFGGDVTGADSADDDQNTETTSKRSLQITNIPLNFTGEQVLLTVPINSTDQLDGSIVNFDVSSTPAGVDASSINGVQVTETLPELRIRASTTNLSGAGEIQLLYEAVGFADGVTTTGDTITSLDIFFNETEILADTNSAPITLVDGASLFGFGGDITGDDTTAGGGGDQNADTTSKRSLQITNIPLNFTGEQVLLTIPINLADQFDGSVVNFDVSSTPAGVQASSIDTVNVTPAPVSAAVNLSIDPTSGSEAEATTFTITATADSAVSGEQTIDLALTGSATGDDFDGDIPTTITIADGATTGTASVTVTRDSVLFEGGETATFTISNPSAGLTLGSTTEVSATIADDPLSVLDDPLIRYQNTAVPGTFVFAGLEEANSIDANFVPPFVREGGAFDVSLEAVDGLVRFNRFQNTALPGTFLFATEGESVSIRNDFPQFREEGIAFYAYGAGAGQGTEYFRMQNSSVPGTFIFVNATERDQILANFPQFTLEGTAFEVAPSSLAG